MKSLKHLVWIGIALMLGACATVGKEVTQEQLAGFKQGETTLPEVTARLGQPTSSTLLATGGRSISYVFAHAQVRAASLIPIVGPLVGGTDSRSSMVIFSFGPDGKLLNFVASQSQLGMGTGLAAGSYQPRTEDQPREVAR